MKTQLTKIYQNLSNFFISNRTYKRFSLFIKVIWLMQVINLVNKTFVIGQDAHNKRIEKEIIL